MARYLNIFVLLLSSVVSQVVCVYVEALVSSLTEHEPPLEPQIAMKCGFINMRLNITTGEWISDEDTSADCVTERLDVLAYCRKAYPALNITNVVESNNEVKISNWCRKQHKKCKWTHAVVPYRCIVGRFQSDPLQVPDKCKFEHIHDGGRCQSYGEWKKTAEASCLSTGKTLFTYGMLLPCGIDVFDGVEYVCCPQSIEEEERSAVDNNVFDVTMTDGEEDPYFHHSSREHEHAAFKKAEARLEETHRAKVTKVMKDWGELEEKYQYMKSKDPAGAEKFKKDMSAVFQKTVASLEEEWQSLRRQLIEEHLTRVEFDINERKHTAMETYLDALKSSPPQAHKILKALQKYIRAEEKDRSHTINHYRHLVNTNPENAAKTRQATLEHLSAIDGRINKTIELLDRVPRIQKKILDELNEFLKDIHSDLRLDSSDTVFKLASGVENSQILDQYKEEMSRAKQIEQEKDREFEDEPETADEMESVFPSDLENEVEIKTERPPSTTKFTTETTEDATEPQPIKFDENEVEPEEEMTDVEKAVKQAVLQIVGEPQVAHHRQNSLHVEQGFNDELRHSSSKGSTKGLFMAISLGGVALLTAIIVAAVVAKKRTQPQNPDFVEVEQTTPEEKHLSNMQMNGYENPTYRYFETYTN